MKRLFLIICSFVPIAIAACSAPGASMDLQASPSAAPSSNLSIDVSKADTSALAAELYDRVVAAAPPKLSATPPAKAGTRGIEGVQVTPLGRDRSGRPLWAAFSYGLVDYLAGQSHFVAIYTYSGSGWEELARLTLPNQSVGYISANAVTQASVDTKDSWLEISGTVGAHSGWFGILRFDGQDFQLELSHNGSSPGRDYLADLSGDGNLEAVLDETDNYVFFYASGVRLFGARVMRWDGSRMAEVVLTRVADDSPAELIQMVNRALDLANAGLFKEAAPLADQILAMAGPNETAKWDALLLRLLSAGRAKQAASGAYPILDLVFDGDYAGAADIMRQFQPAQIFSQGSPLIVGTVAERWEKQLSERSIESANRAIQLEPDLASAYYVRGWARFIVKPDDPAALSDIKKSAELAPSDQLFAASTAFLSQAR